MGEVMTRRSATGWYHLAIAAVLPLVLTVCATGVSQLDDLYQEIEVDPPSSAALAAVEPDAPALPLMEAAAAPEAVLPALDGRLVGEQGAAAATPSRQPRRPPHPLRLAVSPLGEVAAPGIPTGAGADGAPAQRAPAAPARPAHPALLAERIAVPGAIAAPAGAAGADGAPRHRASAAPTRPGHPALLAAPMRAPGELPAPAGAGRGGAPRLTARGEPSRPPHPRMLAVARMDALAEPAAPASASAASALRRRAGLVAPARPPHPVAAAPAPVSPTWPQPPGGVGPTIVQSPTDTDFDRVRVLIARAEEVGAQFYDPQNLDGAREALGATEGIRGVDPVGSHVVLRAAEGRANAAFDNSVRLAADRLRNLLQDRLEELREIQADLWVPVSFQQMVDAVRRAERWYESGDYFGAYRLALATADDMRAVRDALLDRLELLYGARTEVERCLAAAQQLDTSDWSADRTQEMRSLYQRLNTLYLIGQDAIRAWQLIDAEEAFAAAIEVCRTLMGVADDAWTEQLERAAALLQAVMQELEAASRLHVATEQGDVIKPQPWSGRPVLEALRAGAARRGEVLDGAAPGPAPADLAAAEGLTWTLAAARSLWIEGVGAFDDHKYGQSIRLFEDARRYLERYKFYAVLGIHVVQLIPERRESLWRIAEYPRWYRDPFLWPRIWRRNRELIRNPDLIYPNWELIIPAP